ncbi:TetR/AcrR family transcriptional regulator [Robbsia sp. Bb-Pol-6]|uniref:TetR/AcrR family transcriptional regulator n=1 Tax=Robbsia betulipollinis TaxID=2981849 RepID=A0ABT3ZKM4_9BURK|nr:TetR/AcrR family transcriptional regulator [Robbsia betulipollinis]MCY0386493.1 TetR/AcrR family transcriptional regulator [Robbsia betulipollinis]
MQKPISTQSLVPDSKTTATRARGRPRAFDRDLALREAMRLFWEKGYEATSLSDLTEAMGIGAKSLYAAFGSKESLYAESLAHYCKHSESFVWAGFQAAKTAREAITAFLTDSAEALGNAASDLPRGCMVTLSAVGSEGYATLGTQVRAARGMTLSRLTERIAQAIAAGELAASVDVHALARFVQAVQGGMSILARDGATREELLAVARTAVLGWDARVLE